MVFLSLVTYRLIAGMQNGHGYGHNDSSRHSATLALIGGAASFILWLVLAEPPTWLYIIGVIAAIISGISAWMIELIFTKKLRGKWADIHFWEMFKTAGVAVTAICAGANIIFVACSVYPGLILHKGMVNINSGHPWWYTGTDDETGKTFRIPLLNISIPRSSNAVRITLAVISTALMVLADIYAWHISIW